MTTRTNTDWRRLRELAAEKRDACTRALGEALGRAAEAERKLQMLTEYRGDYTKRMSDAGASGLPAERLHHFRRFLQHLDRALQQQSDVASAAEQQVAVAQARLQESQRTVDSYQVLVDRQQTAAATIERRQQQKQTDEYASRLLPRFLTGSD
jgi:flagellar FliJ protein